MKVRFILIAIFSYLVIPIGSLNAQDGLDDMLDDMEEEETIYTIATFKGSRIINLHTIESVAKNQLEFRISHRFGALEGGAYELFGLDQSTIRIGLEYGITDYLTVGWGRSTYQKTNDGFLKLRILRQSKGKKIMPVSLVYLSGVSVNGLRWENPDRENFFTSRLSYAHQLIIARKFNKRLSFQVSPTLIHRNLVETINDQNTSLAIGTGGRIKLNGSLALTAEYVYRIPPAVISDSYAITTNSFSLGLEIETGGHVFQLQFTNSLAMFENGFIMQTNEEWKNIGIHFGFNISREFALKH